jgi:hypothetical protein
LTPCAEHPQIPLKIPKEHGGSDPVVRPEQSRLLKQMLDRNRVPNQRDVIEGQTQLRVIRPMRVLSAKETCEKISRGTFSGNTSRSPQYTPGRIARRGGRDGSESDHFQTVAAHCRSPRSRRSSWSMRRLPNRRNVPIRPGGFAFPASYRFRCSWQSCESSQPQGAEVASFMRPTAGGTARAERIQPAQQP